MQSTDKKLEPSLEIVETPDMVVVENRSSRETTPSYDSPVVRKSHYKIRTLPTPRRNPSPQSDILPIGGGGLLAHGLPYKGYKKNPLASNCSCHAYAIEHSHAFLFPITCSPNNDPFSTCCELCRGKCYQ